VAGFGLGSAFMALCTRLCGVVYLKSSAVGVRIVQQQMGAGAAPADDPRNPVVIASHVGLLLNAVGASIADLVRGAAGPSLSLALVPSRVRVYHTTESVILQAHSADCATSRSFLPAAMCPST
jgi:Na+/H+-translocating membrane pyrophosphatase